MRAATRVGRRFALVIVLVLTTLGLATPTALAQSSSNPRPPELVVLGDSFAAGSGNPQDYDGLCGRSNAAYGPVLERFHLVNLQAFVACGGAKTVDVATKQISSITAETDLITVQALGNDFYFGDLSFLCLTSECTYDSPIPNQGPITVQEAIESIKGDPGKDALSILYTAINEQMEKVKSSARVFVVGYDNPFPSPNGPVGPLCSYMTNEELSVAKDVTNALNIQLQKSARTFGFTFINTDPLSRRLDVCGPTTASFRPPGLPGSSEVDAVGGALHPNELGQSLYAAAVAARLYWR